MKLIWNVGIYARVSTDKKEQQESIPAQVQSLKKWLEEKQKTDNNADYNLVEVYEDAGFSGSNFNRTSFLKMKTDIEQGKINMVITRDLSRFARNYITAGYYLEDYFKVNNIRFVSVLDNVDTQEEFNDIIPFKNILNEMYIKDCSRKTKDGLKQRMLTGSSIASKPPYGYKFEEENCGGTKKIKLVSSEDNTTEVVRKIFMLYIQGWSMNRIASFLNQEKIPSPSVRLNYSSATCGIWNSSSIRYILTNPKYGGIMAQQRWRKISYKTKRVEATAKSEWIYGDEFEGIISRNDYEEVQKQIKKRAKNYRHKGTKPHIFTSVLQCNECGGSMCYRKNYKGYKCSDSQKGGGRCSAHSIKEAELFQIVSDVLKEAAKKYINNEEICSEFRSLLFKNTVRDVDLKNIEKELKKLDSQFIKVYSDRLNNYITDRNYELLIKYIQINQEKLIKEKERILNKDKEPCENFRKIIDEILSFQQIDRQLVENFIDKIVISEDKNTKEKKADIYYKFRI